MQPAAALCKELNNIAEAVAYPGILLGGGGVKKFSLGKGERGKGDGGGGAPRPGVWGGG